MSRRVLTSHGADTLREHVENNGDHRDDPQSDDGPMHFGLVVRLLRLLDVGDLVVRFLQEGCEVQVVRLGGLGFGRLVFVMVSGM